MKIPMPPLNALRAFEAAARHLSLTKAAAELHVTAGALSHQIRGLEELLGMKLFERRVRSIALTTAGKQLYPGLQTGFLQIREAVASLRNPGEGVLVISTSPGLTSKWLAPRLYRFAAEHPEIETRISSTNINANFATDGIDMAVRNLANDHPNADPTLATEKLVEVSSIPVCSPRLIESLGPLDRPDLLARAPLIHDESLIGRINVRTWSDWFAAAGVPDVDVRRGLHFNSADHALDAAVEGAGVLLVYDVLAYDDLRTGRLVIPVRLALPTGRAYHVVWPKTRKPRPQVEAFRAWLQQEIAALDWKVLR